MDMEGKRLMLLKEPWALSIRNCYALPKQLTEIRHPYGTWQVLLSAALFPT